MYKFLGRSHASALATKKTTLSGGFYWWACSVVLRFFIKKAPFYRRSFAALRLNGTLPCASRLIPNSLSRTFSRLSANHKKTTLSGGFYWWALRGSNSRPSRCKRDALPAELSAHLICNFVKLLYTLKFQKSSLFFINLSIFYMFYENSMG